jgi:signal transduction histidine kinase
VQQNHVQQETGAADTEEFMSVAVHDLRNPIAVVRASAQMAQRQLGRGDTDGAQGRLKAIVQQTDRLTEMLETFLDAARIGAGRLPIRTEPLDLREVVDTAVQRVQTMLGPHTNRTVEVAIADDCTGSWDRARIVRAVHALVANAMLYGDAEAPVRIDALCDARRVKLHINGGGPGPDQEEVAHLFERFYRGRSAAEAGQSGSGLGLFIAQGIIRRHGGDVRRLEGDTFEIELPRNG